jgi:hypothetical protein
MNDQQTEQLIVGRAARGLSKKPLPADGKRYRTDKRSTEPTKTTCLVSLVTALVP